MLDYAAAELRGYSRALFNLEIGTASESTAAEIKLISQQLKTPGLDAIDSFELRPTPEGIEIHGSNDRSTLYGVYELVRSWGAQFYLSGDVLPNNASCTLPAQPIRRQAVMKMRGVHPYPDFLSGPSSWDEEQFEKYLRQLPKLGLNFYGIHQYTYEPYFDYEVDGVHPRSGRLETSAMREWGYGTQPTCEFEVGRELFDGCVWGSRAALEPTTPEERYAAGERLMAFSLRRARELGLVTAFGFEPMVNDPEFAELAKSPTGARKVLEARINGVFRAFPALDYLWLFADETNQSNAAVLRHTYELIGHGEKHLKSNFPGKQLMVGGWNAEPTLRQYDRGHRGVRFASDTMFTSYGNYDPWRTVRENRHELFRELSRPHAIAAWCEYDGRLLTGIQPNVSAYEAMHARITETGSTGFFFLHWNTRACDSNLDYLRKMAWERKPTAPGKFYLDYFQRRFDVPGEKLQQALLPVVRSTLDLEQLNKAISLSSGPFTLMGDDWTTYGPWNIVAEAVWQLRSGRPLGSDQRARFRDQVKRATRLLADYGPALWQAEAAYRELAGHSRSDSDTSKFLANRTQFFAAYARSYLELSRALEHLLRADELVRAKASPAAELRALGRQVRIPAWLELMRLYTEFVDDRGELGIIVSLNQKLLGGLRRLEKSLSGL